MAFVAARGLARAASVAARPGLRLPSALPAARAAPMAWQQGVPAACLGGVRHLQVVAKYTRDEAIEKLDDFHAMVLSANWGDYLVLVYNVPFWEAELEKLTAVVQPYLHEPTVGAKMADLQEMMDVMYQCEDVRDFINELGELKTRSSGLMGTGFMAAPPVENFNELSIDCAKAYDTLLAKHPNFKPKIEQTVGHGLAILRSKTKFKFGSMHRYFF